MLKLPIDHIGILAPEITPLIDEFQRLGFTVVGPKELTAIDADGNLQGLGQYSAHVMFADNYIELTAVEKPTPDHHLADFLSPPWGVRLVLLGSEDIQQSRASCVKNGMNPFPVQAAARELDYLDGVSARFEWFGLPHTDWPECLTAFVQHHSREQVFDTNVCRHANGAIGLSRLTFNRKVPKRFSKLLGSEDAHSDESKHLVELCESDRADGDGPEAQSVTPICGVDIAVADLALTERLVTDAGFDPVGNEREVRVRLQSNTLIRFRRQ